MRIPVSRFFQIFGGLALALALPGISPASVRTDAAKISHVYVSNDATNSVLGYDARTGKLVEQLTGFNRPQGLAIDPKGNLYVADSMNKRVVVFAPGKTTPSRILHDSAVLPASVAIAPNGDVAVVNNPFKIPGVSVSFYHAGATHSYLVVNAPPFSTGLFCAYDLQGDLYIDGASKTNEAVVAEIVGGGSGAMVNLGISGVQQAAGLAVTGNGDYLVGDAFNNVVDEFAAGSNVLVATIPLAVTIDAPSLALSSSGSSIWVAAVDFSSGKAEALEFPYPGGGAPVDTIAVGSGNVAYGIAVSP